MDKIVNLKNNLKCKLTLSKIKGDESYYINATSGNSLVGRCKFDIIKVFARPLNDKERSMYALHHKLNLQDSPKDIEVKRTDLNAPSDTIVINDHTYSLKYSYCDLDKIEVLHKDFIGVGLGSAMFNMLENFATSKGCSKVEVYCYPYGEFKLSTIGFYTRNGFKFTKNSYATKDLSKALEKDNLK